jgi:hypothetical protein
MTQAATTVHESRTVAATAPGAEPGHPYGLAAIAGVAVFLFYALTLGPTTWFWDTSEYIATGHILGIPHPPGNPVFVLLARAWDVLLSPLEGLGLNTARRINLFSAFMSAGTHFFWFLMVHRVLRAFTDREVVRRVGAGVAVLISATAYTVWTQSNVNEKVYTVSLFTIAAISWIAFLWRDHVEAHSGTRGASRWHDDNAVILVVFILAVSVGNHLMAFLAAPALFVFLLAVKPRVLANWKLYVFAIAFGLLGLSVNLFLPLRSALDPVINEAAPTCPSVGSAIVSVVGFGRDLPGACQSLSEALAREQYQKPSLFDRQAPFGAQLLNYLQYFDWQWGRSVNGRYGYFGGNPEGEFPLRPFVTLLFLLLGGYGVMEHRRRERKSFLYMATLFVTLSLGLVLYMNFKYGYVQVRAMNLGAELSEVRERDYFFLVSFSLWGLWAGMGLVVIWQALAESLRRPRALALASPVLALAFVPMVLNWGYASRRTDWSARDFAYNLLQSVEPYGVLFTNGDNDTFPLWYVQEVEGVRRDVTVIVMSYLNTPWYARQLREITKPCERPNQALEDPTRIICQRPFEADKAPALYRPLARVPRGSILPISDAEIDGITRTSLPVSQDMIFAARGIQAHIRAGTNLLPADQLLLHIVQRAWGDRPIYFAATTNVQFDLGFYPFTERQGMAFKLITPQEAAGAIPIPIEDEMAALTGAYVRVDRNRALLHDAFQYHGLDRRAHWTDDATRNIPMHFSYAFMALARAEGAVGDAAGLRRAQELAESYRELATTR